MSDPSGHHHLTPHRAAYWFEAALEGDTSLARLVAACPECREVAEILVHWSKQVRHPNPHVAAEVATVEHLLPELLEAPRSQRRALITTEPEYQSWGLASVLLDILQLDLIPPSDDPIHLAELAGDIVGVLDRDFYEPERCRALRARARLVAALVLLRAGRMRQASQRLQEAEKDFEAGTRYRWLEWELAAVKARIEETRAAREAVETLALGAESWRLRFGESEAVDDRALADLLPPKPRARS